MKLTKILDGEYSTLLGMNGGMVESPDGKQIIYAAKKDLSSPRSEVRICSSDLTDHRTIAEVDCPNHNGPSATFLNDHEVVFREVKDNMSSFYIMDINTLKVRCHIAAKESHCGENGMYPFSISSEYLGKNPEYPQITRSGIYLLNLSTGDISLAASEEQLLELVKSHGLTPTETTASVSHVQLNPSATSVMMRMSVKECPVFGALGCFDLDTGNTHLIPDKPVHQLWFDDETYMATRQFYRNGRIEMDSSYIARFSKDGEELEVLGGISNHMDADHTRTLFAGDRCYPGYSTDVSVYRRGSKEPLAVFEIPHFEEIVWKKQVHPNPSFSRDGKRLYFNRPCSNDKTEAVFADISELYPSLSV